MQLYETALKIATAAHKGQKDKAGAAYINHPLFVSSLVGTNEEKAAALLHDVLEDTEQTQSDLLEAGIPEDVVQAVVILTKRKDVDYCDYLRSVKNNEIARKVKIADLTHNMDISRISNPTTTDFERVGKYKKAYDYLNSI